MLRGRLRTLLPLAMLAAATPPMGEDGTPLLSRRELLAALATVPHPAPHSLQAAAFARALAQPPQLWAGNATWPAEDALSDLARIEANTRVAPAALVRPSAAWAVAVATPRSCNAAAVSGRASCAALLSACLTRVVTDADGTCACYAEHGRCYRRAGCADLLPRGDVRYCFDTLHCSLRACEGSSAGAAALTTWALAGAVLMAGAAAAAAPPG